jgi:hypothetical protein
LKYDGLSIVPQTHDQKTRFLYLKYHVGAVIRGCQGPRFDQANIDMVESQCAILMCEWSAKKVVINFPEKHGRDPLKSELFALLDQQLLGSISGDLTVCKKLAALHCDDLARILKARMIKGAVSVDLPSVLNLAKAEPKLRPVQMDSASHVLWILNLFRDQSDGKRVNGDMQAIRETAENCMSGGVWVEQMDPISMLKSVASCGVAWDSYDSTVLSRPGANSGGASGSGGASDSGQSAQMQRPSKRPFTSMTPPNANQVQGAARQAFDPFVSIPGQCMVRRDDGNVKFIRGQNREAMEALMKLGKCVLCKQSGHFLAACPSRQEMFASKKFCFHPSSKR